MRRREFIGGLGGAAAWPLAARAQWPSLPTIGVLDQRPVGASREDFIDPFLRGLAETGFVEGRNVAIEIRSSDGHKDRLSALAVDFVRQKVALIFAPTNNAALAAKEATQTIPVVFFTGFDPVETGVVASLNRPGGNLTGVAILATEIAGKRLDLLHMLVPAAHVVGMLTTIQSEIRDAQSAADSIGVRLLLVYGQTDSEIAAAFASLVEQKAAAPNAAAGKLHHNPHRG
jgi:putative tryptophan/tyrosine transport system substrate-binding protein